MAQPKQRPTGELEPAAPAQGAGVASLDGADGLYRHAFDATPLAVWIEDWSGVRREVDRLRARGVTDIAAYLLENPDRVRELDGHMEVLDFNDAAVAMLGAPDKAAIWGSMDDVSIQTDDDVRIYAELIGAFAAGEIRTVSEGWIGAYDEHEIYARDTAAIAPDRFADWGRVVHSIEDITREHYNRQRVAEQNVVLNQAIEEREWAEAALRASERRLSDAARIAGLGHYTWEPGAVGLTFCSEEYAEIFGMTPGECLARHGTMEGYVPFIHPDDRARYGAAAEAIGPDAPAYELEYRVFRSDGEVRHIVESGYTEFEADGAEGHSVGVLLDITERKRAEIVSRERERQLSDAARIAGLGHYAWAPEPEGLTYCSEEYARILGMTPGECLAHYRTIGDYYRLVHPDDLERYRAVAYDGVQPDSPAYEIEYRIVRPDGEVHHIVESGHTAFDAGGVEGRSVGVLLDITERKAAEAQLAAQKEQLRQAIQVAKIGHYAWDEVADRLVYCSPEYAAIFGWTVEEMLEAVAEFAADVALVHPDDREAYLSGDIVSGASPEHPRVEGQYRIIRPDGGVRHVHEICLYEFDDDGNPVRSTGAIQDVTEQMAAQTALRESEERYAVAARAGHFGHFEWHEVEHRLSYCSEEFARIHGLSVEECREMFASRDGDIERVHPDDREHYETAAYTAEDQPTFSVDYRIVRPDGTVRHVHEFARAVYDDKGQPLYSRGILQDVTEIRQVEEALRESETKLRSFIGNLPGVVFRLETDVLGIFSFVSQGIAELSGYAAEELVGTNMERIVHPDDWGGLIARTMERLADGEPLVAEYRILHKDGTVRWVHEQSSRVTDESGRACFFDGVLTDITERKATEEKAREKQGLLELAQQGAKLGYWRWRKEDGRAFSLSDEFRRILDVSGDREFHSFEDIYALAHPGDQQRIEQHDREIMAELRDYALEYRIVHGDGKILHVIERGTVEYDEAGNAVGYIGTLQDITELKQAETRLAEKEEQLRRTVRIAQIGHYVWDDVNDRLVQCSAEYAAIHGMTVDELMGGHASKAGNTAMVHRDDRERYLASGMWAPTPDAPRSELTYRIVRSDGEVRYLHEICETEFDEAGAPERSTGTVQDVTELKRAEEALRDSDERYADAARLGHLGHFEWDEVEERLTYCSEEYARIFGFTVEEYSATYDSREQDLALVHPDDRERYENEAFYTDKKPFYSVDYRILRPDGVIRHIHEFGRTSYDKENRPLVTRGAIQDITERAQAELALRENERFLNIAQDTAKLGYWVWDNAGQRVTSVSENFRRIWDLGENEEVVDLSDTYHRIHPDDVEEVKALDSRQREAPFGHDQKFRIVQRDGTVIHVVEQVRVQCGSDGEVIGYIGTLQDVTELKRAEVALRDSEERFRSMVANVPDVIYRCAYDADWTMAFISDAVAHVTGYPARDFLDGARSFASLHHPEDLDSIRQAVEQSIAMRQPFTVDYRIFHADGSIRHIHEAGRCVFGADGEISHLDGAMIDVTDLEKTRAALRESEDRFRSLVSNLPGAVFRGDFRSDEIVYVSAGIEELTGLPADAFTAMPNMKAFDFILDEDKSRVEAALAGIEKSSEPLVLDYRIRHGNGSVRWVLEMSRPTRDVYSGELRWLDGILLDITDKKEIEDQLILAKTEAERANAAKSEFLAKVSHDLRTPLNAVTLYSELLRDNLVDLKQEDLVGDVDKILFVASHQLDLVNDLLDMSRIEAGEINLVDEEVALDELVETCLAMVREQADEGEVALDSSFEVAGERLRGDKLRLKQVLINLLSNAVKFTPRDGTVRLDLADGPDGGVTFRVSDTGIGMAPEDIPKAIEKFSQIKKPGQDAPLGTGLGLPIAKSLAEAHGGSFEIESALGEGTTVTVILPAERVLRPETH